MAEGDFFADNAVLNLGNYNGNNVISVSATNLNGLSSKIKTIIFPENITPASLSSNINTIGCFGAVAALPSWIKNTHFANVTNIDLSYVTSTTFNLSGLRSNVIHLLLAPAIESVTNMPNTVTHLSAYYGYLRNLNLNNTLITHLTLRDGGDITVANNFLCDLNILQSFSAPFATIKVDGGANPLVELRFLCNNHSLQEINMFNIDVRGIEGRTLDSGECKIFNWDGRLASIFPGTSVDDDLMVAALNQISGGEGKTLSNVAAPLLLLYSLFNLYSGQMGPALALKPLVELILRTSPTFARNATGFLTKVNTVMTVAQGISTVISAATFAEIALMYGDDSAFDDKRGRLRSLVRLKSGDTGQAVRVCSELSALTTITINSVNIIGGPGGRQYKMVQMWVLVALAELSSFFLFAQALNLLI